MKWLHNDVQVTGWGEGCQSLHSSWVTNFPILTYPQVSQFPVRVFSRKNVCRETLVDMSGRKVECRPLLAGCVVINCSDVRPLISQPVDTSPETVVELPPVLCAAKTIVSQNLMPYLTPQLLSTGAPPTTADDMWFVGILTSFQCVG